MVDDISNTTGNVGDKIGCRFSFKAKTKNTASITDAMINQVQLSGLGAPSNVAPMMELRTNCSI
ncbi:Putative CscC cell-surface protein, WxL2 domain (frameshift) [Latilactobacillus curvatus]|nr:Putative CscC cell-surface protein, WxL2 domain (frameshift) [Latilactobacillus curvatus]